MSPKIKKIIIVTILIILLVVAYAIFVKGDPNIDPLIKDSATSAGNDINAQEAQRLGEQISQALLRIEKIKLDKGVFTNEIYNSLKDRSQPIIDEPMGRPNPFAPIGDLSINSSARTATSSQNRATSSTTTTPR